ncbi:MAG: Si-specific NAD(P)(+) transhydrogenase [Thermoleophilia bacterium]
MSPAHDFDLLVIGSGPAGKHAAIQAAKLGRRAAICERAAVVGGVCVNTGTIPSKTLREAVMYLAGMREQGNYGSSYQAKQHITVNDLLFRSDRVVQSEIDVTRSQLMRNDVEIITGHAEFTGPHELRITQPEGRGERAVTAAHVVIATGTSATKNPKIPFDGTWVLTSDDVLNLERLPRTMAVIGAGVIGLEYASIFAALGVRVTLIDRRPRILPFVDGEIVDALMYHLRERRMTAWLGEDVDAIEHHEGQNGERVRIKLASGKEVLAECVLYSIGRTGATASLNLEAAGLGAGERGLLTVNDRFQTEVPHIYAVGDVIGFPSLASTSMEQGRLAACHAFGVSSPMVNDVLPFGIYAIPEISMVGRTEEDLTAAGIPYEVGKARYREIARGMIAGDTTGILKLIFHRDTRALLGVHILGEGATELVHIGQAVLTLGGTVDYFVNSVFNYPTLAECYKTAAFDGVNRLAG